MKIIEPVVEKIIEHIFGEPPPALRTAINDAIYASHRHVLDQIINELQHENGDPSRLLELLNREVNAYHRRRSQKTKRN